MRKPDDYDQVSKFSDGVLPPGGYICKIIKVQETASKNGNPMIKVALDIADGEYEGFYSDRFYGNTSPERKWPCIFHQLIYDARNGGTHRGFKTFCEGVAESNHIAVPWGDQFAETLKGKLIGVLFRREEFVGQMDGRKLWMTKPTSWKTVQEIQEGKFRMPQDKPLNTTGNQVAPAATAYAQNNPANQGYDPYRPKGPQQMSMNQMPAGFEAIDDDDVPF